MTESPAHPLVTLGLFSYNQESFIRQAVEGALRQTYSPLEIIISDDCSTDGTFGIIEAMAADYKGPHKIIINRNSRNVGIINHVALVESMASGGIFIAAAGDDISVPERVLLIVDVFLRDSRCFYVHSAATKIDKHNNILGNWESPGREMFRSLCSAAKAHSLAIGATAAWRNSLIKGFPAIDCRVQAEDLVLGFRALMLGSSGYVSIPLVFYRFDTGVTSKAMARHKAHMRIFYVRLQHLRDSWCKRKMAVSAFLILLLLETILKLILLRVNLLVRDGGKSG